MAELASYEVTATGLQPRGAAGQPLIVRPGDRIRVAVQWRALRDLDENYTVFVHLTDRAGRLIAQQDGWPRRKLYPTILWLPHEVVPDEYELRIPADATPSLADLTIGMYRYADLKRLPVSFADPAAPPLDSAPLGVIKVAPAKEVVVDESSLRSRPDAVFAESIRLLGHQLAVDGEGVATARPRRGRPGSKLAVTLFWRAERRPARDYTVFLHLVGPDGKLVAQSDGLAGGSAYPSGAWDAGEALVDRHEFQLPNPLAPGTYRLLAGLYSLDTGARLTLADGSDAITLESVELDASSR